MNITSLMVMSDEERTRYPDLEMMLVALVKWVPFVLCAIGLPGNLISFLVTMKKDNRRISTCIYMAALSIMDSGVLLGAMWLRILVFHDVGRGIQDRFTLLAYFWYNNFTFGISSGLTLAGMSIDRAIAIKFPMKARRYCIPSRAFKCIICLFLIPATININIFFTNKLVVVEGLESIIRHVPNALWVETLLSMYRLFFGTVTPFLVLVVCNGIIIVEVRKASLSREKMTSEENAKKQQERNLTRILIFVSLAYLFCSIPFRAFELIFSIPSVSQQYEMEDPYWSLRYHVTFWYMSEHWHLNYVVNFYLYFIGGGRKFRRDALYVMTYCWSRKK